MKMILLIITIFKKKYLFTDMIIYIHVSNSHIINLKIVSYFTKVKWGFSLIILSQHHLVYLGRSLIFQQLSLSLRP